MATYRGQGTDSFSIGSAPPNVLWTLVRGDTAAFRVYVTDENRNPLTISEWTISMDIVRPTSNNSLIVSLSPEATLDYSAGVFTVSLSSGESEDLETGDIFYASIGTEHVAHPIGVARILVVENEGSV